MIIPEDLLRHAEVLINLRKEYRPNLGALLKIESDTSHAISSAYYAVFHTVLREAAFSIVGANNTSSPLYPLVYRSIEHKQLREICLELSKVNVKPAYQKYIPASGLGSDIGSFCDIFVELYELRMMADYDPTMAFGLAQAETTLKAARTAIERFMRVDQDMKRIFLTLLLFRPR